MPRHRVRTATRPRVAISEYTIDPASAAAAGADNDDITIRGARVGDVLVAFAPSALIANVQPFVTRVGTADQMRIRMHNPTAGAVDAASQTWVVANLRGLPLSEVTIDPASVAADVAPSQNVTVEGLRVGDVILAIPPAAILADVTAIALRVSAANTLPLRFANGSVGAVDATAQTWVLANLRGFPMTEFTIDPASVAANVAPAQTVTIAGLRVGDVVLAVPPQALIADVAFVPLRVSVADALPHRAFNPTLAAVNAAAQTWVIVKLT